MRLVLKRLMAAALLATLLAATAVAGFALLPMSLDSPTVEFSIRPGTSLRAAARQMEQAGVPVYPGAFAMLARVAGQQRAIKAGNYEIPTRISRWELLRRLTAGEVMLADITLVEGWTLRQMRAALAAHPGVRQDSAGLSERELMARLGAPDLHPEGQFFPDTYLFARGESDLAILGRAHRAMRNRLESAWSRRASGLPFKSGYEALILASIVEKETGVAAERGIIAGVFVNRLRLGMPLQTDPTVIYGLGPSFDGNLRRRDLVTDTPYNTYTRGGLPPTPIANPGMAALLAAVNPEATSALYFVSRGDGTHVFSRTLEEHNRAVSRYQRGGR